MRKIFIAGGAHTNYLGKFHPDFIWKKHPDFGTKTNPDTIATAKAAVLGALEAVGASADVIERAFIGNFAGELFDNQGHLGAALASVDPALEGKPIMRVEGACASGGLALALGCDAIRAGADVVLIAGAEVQNTVNAKIGADFLARAAHYSRQRDIDSFTFPALFGRRTKHVVEQTETTMDDLALASVKAYSNANRNPHAHMSAYKGMTYDNASTASDKNPVFLAHEAYRPYLRVSDCSQVSDGGSALLLCSEAGLAKLGKAPGDATEVASCVVSTASLAADPDPLVLANTKNAIDKAYAEAGVSAADLDIAEVHDCFTVNEILMYEALGLAAPGKGAQLLRDGVTAIDGKIPVNTGGGLVGFGHPVGATGVKQALEIHRQLTGQCGDYQIAGTPSVGVSANMGGDDRTSVVAIYKKVS